MFVVKLNANFSKRLLLFFFLKCCFPRLGFTEYWVLGTGTWGILELNLNWVIGCLQKLDPCLYKGFQYIVLIEVDHCPNMHASYLLLVLWVLETEIYNTLLLCRD